MNKMWCIRIIIHPLMLNAINCALPSHYRVGVWVTLIYWVKMAPLYHDLNICRYFDPSNPSKILEF